MLRHLLLLLLVAPALFATTPIELARVNDEIITDADLKAAFVGKHGGHTAFLGGEVEARRFLDIVINERLLVQEGYNLELELDPDVKPQVDEFRGRKSAEYLARLEFESKAEPTEDEIRAAWEKAKDLYVAREIVLDTPEEAEKVREQIAAGADFGALARELSIGRSRARGGSMNAFTWGSLTPEMEEAVAALEPGALSPVIRGPEGWTIILLLDRLEANRPELDEKVSQRIASRLRERRVESLTSAFSAFLWKEYGAEIPVSDRDVQELSKLLTASPDTSVARWKGGELKIREAFAPAELKMYEAFPPGRATEKIDETLRAAVNTKLIRLEAAKRKIHEVPEIATEIARFEARLIEQVLYAKHVLIGLKVPEEEIRASYEEQKATLIIPERRRVAHIAVDTEEEALDLYRRIGKGEDFADLVKLSLDTQTVKTGGDLGWIEKGKVAETYDELFELAVGGVARPISSGTSWHLVRVTEILSPDPLTFEEAREKIHSILFEKKKHDARKYWIEKLREASEIEVLDEGIRAFVEANPFDKPEQ